MKNIYSKYDFVVSNLLTDLCLDIGDPELIREFFTKSNDGHYEKSHLPFGQIKRLIGYDGIVMKEG